MEKKIYSGLMTQRVKTTCQPIMATSKADVKVKTGTTGTEDWTPVDGGELPTSISTEI